MCGIFGIVKLKGYDAANDERLWQTFNNLAVETETRGRDATGVACVVNKKLHVVKSDIKASEFVDTKEFKKFKTLFNKSRIIIGHTRQQTQGTETDNKNNHPVYSKKSGIAITHNGMIRNYDEIQKKEKFKYDGKVDSEAILKLYEKYKSVDDIFKRLEGSFAVALIDEKDPRKLTLFKHSNPIELIYVEDLNIIMYASLEQCMIDSLTEYKFGIFKKDFPTYYSATMDNDTHLVIDANDYQELIPRYVKVEFDKSYEKVYGYTTWNNKSKAISSYSPHEPKNKTFFTVKNDDAEKSKIFGPISMSEGKVYFSIHYVLFDALQNKASEWQNLFEGLEMAFVDDKIDITMKPNAKIKKGGKKLAKAINKWTNSNTEVFQNAVNAFEKDSYDGGTVETCGYPTENDDIDEEPVNTLAY